ncbi:hypothetical protein M427DRAFT_68898 [Gonapodya prolifera JEL478]|uniref:Uncharacterized protein n=1 Tax=Gonapodya prolifera (strain JEL478) TaxID=1344416 RepID=A0A139AJ29_GONPJ|nr:hypothetical protein M427DRAFT_68898 [Gonapodya prolifera JEL478]|eukprot:KXS16564.1 hypothetical protein M427DRAFT_68898 [Gonapodya prolifera JEL478]
MYSFTQNDSLSLGVDWNYMYPSGLAKQYLNETFMPLADNFDVSARFNSDWNWFLDDEIMGRIQAGDYQLEQIVFHEIIHGLGFISSWYTWLGDGDDVLLPGYVVRNASGLCVGLSKPYIFNKFMADNVNNIWFKDHAEVLRAGTESVTPTDNYTLWLERFRRTPAFSRARTLLRVSQSHMGVTFWFRSPAKPNSSATSILWDYAFLYSPDGFAPGSSLSHVDNKMYDATEDWIMRPSGSPGVKLADYRPQARRYGPVGWRILAMLRALGWRTVLDQPGWGDYGRGIGGVVGAA